MIKKFIYDPDSMWEAGAVILRVIAGLTISNTGWKFFPRIK